MPPEVELMLPLFGSIEAPKYHVVLHVVPGVPDRYIP